jgi:hypothetical protein
MFRDGQLRFRPCGRPAGNPAPRKRGRTWTHPRQTTTPGCDRAQKNSAGCHGPHIPHTARAAAVSARTRGAVGVGGDQIFGLHGGAWSLRQIGNDLNLNFTALSAVPGPATCAVLALALRRKRRNPEV